MNTIIAERDAKRKEFGRFLIFSLLAIFAFYNILIFAFRYLDVPYTLKIDQQTLFFCLMLSSYVGYLLLRKKFDFWIIYKVITVGLYLLVFYLGLVTCHRSMSTCLFFIPVLLMILMQTSVKKTMAFAGLTLTICFFLQSIAEITGASQPELLNESEQEMHRNLTYILWVIAGYLSFLTLYFYNELNKIENKMTTGNLPLVYKRSEEEKASSIQLYFNIIEYMEKKKPYIDPDFTVKILAQRLKSNPTYISRALNNQGGKKFTEFVQEYRIKQIIEGIHNSEKEYSLEQLYKNAGYTNHTTFYRNFKEVTGITPSKYIEALNRKKQ